MITRASKSTTARLTSRMTKLEPREQKAVCWSWNKLKADRVSLEKYIEDKNVSSNKMPRIVNSKRYSSNTCLGKNNDYNSRLDSLQKAISINSSQIVLAESKLLIRPNLSSALSNQLDKFSAAYTNRSNNSQSKKKLKSLASIDMLKKYYKNNRNKYNHVKGAASIQLYDRYKSRLNRNQLKADNIFN